MIFKKEVWITPYQMNRRLHIYVPQRAMEEGRRCPVLYMFDRHNLFEDQEATYGKSWGLKDYLDHSGLPLIVVGMECNHEGNSRLVEYSPYTFTDHQFGTIAGSGRQMMRWVVEELKPLIDRELPTLTSRKDTWIAGSSMGGLMSLYAVTAFNDVYSRAACLSPSIWFATRSLDRLIRDAQFAPDTVIYMDYGSREMAHHDNMRKQYAAVTSRLLEKQVLLTSRIVPNGDHCEACWEEQIPFFMHILFYNRE